MTDGEPKRSFLRRWLRRMRPPRRLKFTREGRYFVAITIGIGLAAINTGNNLLYLLLGWLLSMIVASGVMSERMMRRLAVRRRPALRIFADQPFLMEISVENQKTRVSSFSIEIEDLIDDRPLDKKCFFLKIPPGRTQRTSYRHTFHRRGVYRFGGFRVSTKFPFALFRKSRDVEDATDVLVYPAVHPVPVPPSRARHHGETQQARLGRRGEFFGLREYRDGDDRRDIHWRSSARAQASGGRLLVREYEEEAQRRATIAVDNALPGPPAEPAPPAALVAPDGKKPSSAAKKEASLAARAAAEAAATEAAAAAREAERAAAALEAAISLAASLAQAYLAAGWSVRLIARGADLPFSAGPAQLARILRTLALLPTVADDIAFSGSVDPRAESVLVIPRGVRSAGRPQASHVMDAGATLP